MRNSRLPVVSRNVTRARACSRWRPAIVSVLVWVSLSVVGAETGVLRVSQDGSLAGAVERLGGSPGTIVIDRPLRVDRDVVVPPNVVLLLTPPGRLEVAKDVTVAISGIIQAAPCAVFAGDGDINDPERKIDILLFRTRKILKNCNLRGLSTHPAEISGQ